MNIFVLDSDPVIAAQMQCDKHVVKMVLESAQMLSTVSHALGGIAPYRPTHVHHPCTLWAAQTFHNWSWLLTHAQALAGEYTFRYGRTHKSEAIINQLATQGARPTGPGLTPFAQCIPDDLRTDDPVFSYRLFYAVDKARFARWNRGRQAPQWWHDINRRLTEP